jgi:hypothetical protein
MVPPKDSKQAEVDTGNVEIVWIKWTEAHFKKLCKDHCFPAEFEAEFPALGFSATDNPDRNITIYAVWFLNGNLRIPVTTFLISLLGYYGIHISQLHMMRLCQITNFEFCCRALKIAPQTAMFNYFTGSGRRVHGSPLASVKIWLPSAGRFGTAHETGKSDSSI